jgi:hypothetical protein
MTRECLNAFRFCSVLREKKAKVENENEPNFKIHTNPIIPALDGEIK